MDKKRWVSPVLTVLTRGGVSSEMILRTCKMERISPGGPNGSYRGWCRVLNDAGNRCKECSQMTLKS